MVLKRITYIDVLRISAILGVILIHALAHLGTGFTASTELVSKSLYVFTHFAINTFFLVSGAMTLGKQIPWQEFYKKRFPKIILALIWLPLLSIPFGTFTGHLWFLHATVMFYALSPMISAWLNKAKQQEILGVCLIVLILAMINKCWFFLTQSTWIFDSDFLSYFSLYLLGYYLHTFKINVKKLWLIIIPLLVIGLEIISVFFGWESNFLSAHTSPLNIFAAISIFLLAKESKLLQRLNDKIKVVISNAGESVFGIYLFHMIMLDYVILFVWGKFPHIQYFALNAGYKVLTVTIVTFFVGWLLVFLVKRIPILKKLV